MVIEGFKEVKKKRIVRDDGGILLSQELGNYFYTKYDWPFIEELKILKDKEDSRIALILRDCFDYLSYCEEQGIDHLSAIFEGRDKTAKPTEFKYVTYGSDVDDLFVPFDPRLTQYLLFSKRKCGANLFTVNMNSLIEGPVKMTAGEDKIGEVLMENRNIPLFELIKVHKSRLNGYRHVNKSKLICNYAEKVFDDIMWKSGHVI